VARRVARNRGDVSGRQRSENSWTAGVAYTDRKGRNCKRMYNSVFIRLLEFPIGIHSQTTLFRFYDRWVPAQRFIMSAD